VHLDDYGEKVSVLTFNADYKIKVDTAPFSPVDESPLINPLGVYVG
jgi:hypothetical protein